MKNERWVISDDAAAAADDDDDDGGDDDDDDDGGGDGDDHHDNSQWYNIVSQKRSLKEGIGQVVACTHHSHNVYWLPEPPSNLVSLLQSTWRGAKHILTSLPLRNSRLEMLWCNLLKGQNGRGTGEKQRRQKAPMEFAEVLRH